MEKFDLIVVGTGFASSFFLKMYLGKQHAAKKVLVLERGIFYPHTERLKIPRGEELSEPFKGYAAANNTMRSDNPDKTWVFDPNFGGSSNCWTGCTPRFMPNDFKLKSLYGVGADWPITYDEIEGYYTEAEEIMQIAGPETTPFPKSKPYLLPPQQLSTVDKLIQATYGDLYISQPTARATIATGKRNACCSSTVCQLCPIDSKFTIENSLSDVYRHPDVEIRYNAVVYTMIVENNLVKGVVYKKDGKDHEVMAEVVALGANAIFNAHILLSSGDQSYYTGRGLSDQKGTYGYLYYKNLEDVGGSSIITANGYMLYDGDHRKHYAGCFIEHFNDTTIRNEIGKWRHFSKFKFIFEDIPDDDNRVMLGDDPLIPVLDYKKHTAYVDRSMEKLKAGIEKTFSFLPVEDIILDGYFQKSEFHICSTTRMSNDAESGVVDRNLIHHRYRNLFVLGSSVFPTITPANPTLTLSALSLMAADKGFS